MLSLAAAFKKNQRDPLAEYVKKTFGKKTQDEFNELDLCKILLAYPGKKCSKSNYLTWYSIFEVAIDDKTMEMPEDRFFFRKNEKKNVYMTLFIMYYHLCLVSSHKNKKYILGLVHETLEKFYNDRESRVLWNEIVESDVAFFHPQFAYGLMLLLRSIHLKNDRSVQCAIFHFFNGRKVEDHSLVATFNALSRIYPVRVGIFDALRDGDHVLTEEHVKTERYTYRDCDEIVSIQSLMTDIRDMCGIDFEKEPMKDCILCSYERRTLYEWTCIECIRNSTKFNEKVLGSLFKHPLQMTQLSSDILLMLNMSAHPEQLISKAGNLNYIRLRDSLLKKLGPNWYQELQDGKKFTICIRCNEELCELIGQCTAEDRPVPAQMCEGCLAQMIAEREDTGEQARQAGIMYVQCPNCNQAISHSGGCLHMCCCTNPNHGEPCYHEDETDHGIGCGTTICIGCMKIYNADEIYGHDCFQRRDAYDYRGQTAEEAGWAPYIPDLQTAYGDDFD